MDRRTTSAIVVLALAAIVVIAAWLLKADGAAAPPATVDPAPAADPGSMPRAHPIPDAPPPPPPDEASKAAAARSATPSKTRPYPPRETGDFLIDTARQRARERQDEVLSQWGGKGRVVEAGTGKPLAWKSVVIQVRSRDNPAAVESRGVDRGATPEGDPETLSAFDLVGAALIRGDATLAGASTASIEYRVVAQAWGYRRAVTEWQPLSQGPAAPEFTIALEPDELASL
ncbi:MAG TPA: hypothetical protein VFS92_07805, partial [Planctomycetota bacterium]|nr:hypothetical protein [Planctomycetota bacterium]